MKALALLFICVVSVAGRLSAQDINAPEAILEGVLRVKMTPEQIAKLPKGFIGTAEKAGWERTAEGFQRVVPIKNVELTDATGNVLKPGPDGVFKSLPLRLDKDRSQKLMSESPGRLPAGSSVIENPRLKTKIGELNLYTIGERAGRRVLRIDQAWGEPADCCSTGATGLFVVPKGDPMDDARCLDYNGTNTDGVNYPKSDYRAFVNFVGSDCDIALGQGNCFLDHVNGGCFANHDKKLCSALIGHPSTYHTH
jgi:hypothetical protein